MPFGDKWEEYNPYNSGENDTLKGRTIDYWCHALVLPIGIDPRTMQAPSDVRLISHSSGSPWAQLEKP